MQIAVFSAKFNQRKEGWKTHIPHPSAWAKLARMRVDNLPFLAYTSAKSGRLSTLIEQVSENPPSFLLRVLRPRGIVARLPND